MAQTLYDAIVVGARVAGSPTAMLLARTGYRVLLVDKATFPSDTMSTHFLHTPGGEALQRWGLLDRLLASGCPPIRRSVLDFGITSVSPPVAGDDAVPAYCPRRTVLDKLLVDAAVEAGAELREGFSVQEILFDGDGRVTGIRGRAAGGREVSERARIVIGADGMRSRVAKAVDAPVYHAKPGYTCGYYSYYQDIPLTGSEIYYRPGRVLFAFPTNDGLSCMAMEARREDLAELRSDIEGNFLKGMDLVPALGERVRGGKRVERFVGASDLPNFFRKPYGPGWALVGDAGYHKDPILGWGISDAFRDAELLVNALDAGFSGREPLEEALAAYEQARNQATMPIYLLTTQLAKLEPPSPKLLEMFGRPVSA